MPNPIRGRLLVIISLVVIVALTTGLALLPGTSSPLSPLGRSFRPLLVILVAVLVFQGRAGARWLLALLGLGILLGPVIAVNKHLPPWTLGGAVFWLGSFLYAASLGILFFSKDVHSYFAARSQSVGTQSSGSAGASR